MPVHCRAFFLLLTISLDRVAYAGAASEAQVCGVSLSDSAAAIEDKFTHDAGFQNQAKRTYRLRGVEKRFWLKGSFIRASFASDLPQATPMFLQASFDEFPNGLAEKLRGTLGQPDWTMAVKGGVRVIWGGKGAADAGIDPVRNAKEIVELETQPDGSGTVVLAVPSWFSSQGKLK